MIIHIQGADSFLAKQAIDQVRQKYREKNPIGSELVELDEDSAQYNWANLQAVPLFATSRLVVIKRAGWLDASSQESLAGFLVNIPNSTNVVVWDGAALKESSPLAKALSNAKKISAEPIEPERLADWIRKRSAFYGLDLEARSCQALAKAWGSDLWAINGELQKAALGGKLDTEGMSIEPSEDFVLFKKIRSQDWPGVKNELKKMGRRGEPIELIIGSLSAAVRKEVKDPEVLKPLTAFLLDLDFGLKTGLLDAEAVLALLVAHLPKPATPRVQWEDEWEGTVF